MNDESVKLNSAKAWILASRPKTLSGAAVPVAIGIAAAWQATYGNIAVVPAVLCMLFAFLMQIESNLVNDYFDFVRGRDGVERLGPKRACAEGWVTLKAMRWAIVIVMCAACLVGLPLVLFGGWKLVVVGVACVVFCVLYTTHLSSLALGDILVFLFFGLVPVMLTMNLCSGIWTFYDDAVRATFLLSLACGFVIDTLLVVNNYRDIDGDRVSGKITLVVLLGEKMSLWYYLGLGFVACMLSAVALYILEATWQCALPCVYLLLHVPTWRLMYRLEGRELNRALALNSRNMMVYGLLVVLSLLLS